MSCLEINPKQDLLLSEFVGKFSLRYDPECDYFSDYLVSGDEMTYLTVNEAKANSYVRRLAVIPVYVEPQCDHFPCRIKAEKVESFGKLYSEMFIIRSYLDFCRRGCPLTASKDSQVYANPIVGMYDLDFKDENWREKRTLVETREFTKNFDIALRTGYYEGQPSEIWFSQRTA